MTADPATIAKYTRDGVLLVVQNDALKAQNPNALDGGEIISFFRYEADAQVLLNERADILGRVNGLHDAVEVTAELGIGTRIPVVPVVPSIRLIDEKRDIDVTARTRASAYDMNTDRYSLEMIQ